MRLSVAVAAAALLVAPSHAAADQGSDGRDPLEIAGARVVDLRNTSGQLSRFTSIPSASRFATHGGRSETCSFVASDDGVASDGQRYTRGQTVQSERWIFAETYMVTGGEMDVPIFGQGRGALRDAFRQFNVFCDSTDHFIDFILVDATDPMINPRQRIDELQNVLQLEPPTVWPNPVVARWGGLVTRYPAWLAIGASAWRTQRSNRDEWRGWVLYLLTEPTDLNFWVTFVPDPQRPSTAFDGLVPCVAADTDVANTGVAFPPMPDLDDHTTPGINWPCLWTPPGPGRVTMRALITYHVTFWANGYTEELPDYLWASAPVTFRTGDLPSLNTNG